MTFDPAWLIQIGAAILLIAYFIRDELRLRVLIIFSTFIYIAYYYLEPDPAALGCDHHQRSDGVREPLCPWPDHAGAHHLPPFRDEKNLFDAFETLSPGQFRRVLKVAHWRVAVDPDGTVLTREDEPSGALFYVIAGVVSVQKKDRLFRLPEGNFVGEIAFILKRKTTATTVAPEGVRYVEWDSDALRKLGRKYPNLGNALNALLTRDIAKKLTSSYRPDDALPATRESVELLEAVD